MVIPASELKRASVERFGVLARHCLLASSAGRKHAAARFQGVVKRPFHRAQRLDEFELLALGPLAIDKSPSMGKALSSIAFVGATRFSRLLEPSVSVWRGRCL